VLEKFNVEMIGASVDSIKKADFVLYPDLFSFLINFLNKLAVFVAIIGYLQT
jgi:hypothetical protein